MPSGNWEKVMQISRRQLDPDFPNLEILAVNYPVLYIYSGGYIPYLWECNSETNECSIAKDQTTLPLELDVITFTHDVNRSEVPPIPSYDGQYMDLIEIVSHVSDDISYQYYVLLYNGEIWSWESYWSGRFIGDLPESFLGIMGSSLGIVIAIGLIALGKSFSQSRQQET